MAPGIAPASWRKTWTVLSGRTAPIRKLGVLLTPISLASSMSRSIRPCISEVQHDSKAADSTPTAAAFDLRLNGSSAKGSLKSSS